MLRSSSSSASRIVNRHLSAVELTWQIHSAVEAWTARADVKASIMLAFEGGAGAFIVTSGQLTGRWSGWGWGLAAAALLLEVVAMVASFLVVLPALGSPPRLRADAGEHWLYFGHLRLWEPTALATRLGRASSQEELAVVARQLVAISRLNWRKHRLLQCSVILSMSGLASLALAVLGLTGRH